MFLNMGGVAAGSIREEPAKPGGFLSFAPRFKNRGHPPREIKPDSPLFVRELKNTWSVDRSISKLTSKRMQRSVLDSPLPHPLPSQGDSQ